MIKMVKQQNGFIMNIEKAGNWFNYTDFNNNFVETPKLGVSVFLW